MSSGILELLPFDCLNFNELFGPQLWLSNGWNFMKLLLIVYDHGVMLNVKFCKDVICYLLIALL